MEYEARMRSDEMAMRFSCRQHAMQIRRLDSRWWQKWVASGTDEEDECDEDEAADANEAALLLAMAPPLLLMLLLPESPPIARASADDAPL